MLKFFNKEFQLLSPVDGETFDLSLMPDPVFAQKMAGDGVAINTSGDIFVAPADGEITLILETNHAYGMRMDSGMEVLVHIGVDTVELGGEGFTRLIEPGQNVKAGTPIIKIDREFLLEKNYCLHTPLLITNIDKTKSITPHLNQSVKSGEGIAISYKV
ncbi:PTS system glucose-specific EIIA component [Neobacillus rhizosphaerae]|uniref:PTS system glucose-specific EIIA component n=1 Tax=Neobacillus rhizosphaerae TaxID=2880965 RepID=A0ABM9EPH8_9BACI|nr:PTS glucose transporter subunit IIA [Neobacillus rhizosphaerae]CAH2714039.1 PTS system glucose-specific EIIA component [Neobacillus rhizosphaerae]